MIARFTYSINTRSRDRRRLDFVLFRRQGSFLTLLERNGNLEGEGKQANRQINGNESEYRSTLSISRPRSCKTAGFVDNRVLLV